MKLQFPHQCAKRCTTDERGRAQFQFTNSTIKSLNPKLTDWKTPTGSIKHKQMPPVRVFNPFIVWNPRLFLCLLCFAYITTFFVLMKPSSCGKDECERHLWSFRAPNNDLTGSIAKQQPGQFFFFFFFFAWTPMRTANPMCLWQGHRPANKNKCSQRSYKECLK